MKTVASYLRVIIFMVIAFVLLEVTIDGGDQMAIEKYPIIWGVLAMLALFAAAVEIVSESLKSIMFRGMTPEAQERYLEKEALRKENQFSGIKKLMRKLEGSKSIEEEGEIVLDHNYDGIKELDNKLPPWWLYGFYITIIFAGIYLARYHIFDGVSTSEEFEIEMEDARLAIEEYKKTAKDLVDVNTVELLTEESDLAAGKVIFEGKCAVCHKNDGGGGIGPNLTDQHWILGGGIKNVFQTISEGGRDGKGMVSWKSELSPAEMAQVGSYILTMQGTTPAEPKAPEGEIWVDPDAEAPAEEVMETVVDSIATEAEITMTDNE
ncbi:c-type cytochrome [Aureitalea sp. L0-47]|uniref:cbb3-type cytochrome c oxidase N-terminal domain-containing protein n=1 Tax=Aureitalea sp. L0-47 TaxID=2816962 RepID=UPI002237B60E|nr:cbb3-type cytochrome c oxidase N-terminal domain-containing protein [Aureitalea sp. L0-47]MCW5520092.1 c-type cytochrome [Aureitalea sp. L0-47]